MNILSYRGPAGAGGVSGSLSRIVESQGGVDRWWYLSGRTLSHCGKLQPEPKGVCTIPARIVDGHYRHCNNFIWPILHDLPQFASLNVEDRALYQQFNLTFASNVLHCEYLSRPGRCLVNDYQLANVPNLLTGWKGVAVTVFWHVPWPLNVDASFAPYLADLADGLLGARRIGFHIGEYAQNFMNFVAEHLPEYTVDFESGRIHHEGRQTEIVASALGLDTEFWAQKKTQTALIDVRQFDQVSTTPFVLSVDRADYTKGVLERLDAVDRFFSIYREQIGKVTFVQVCQPTRIGLPKFDEYWQKCQRRSAEINEHWTHEGWHPIMWIDQPISPVMLSALYSNAAAMLINPLRDGLNLTAKEFVSCSEKGVLLLSAGAGVWHELGEHALTVEPSDPESIADQIAVGLSMSQTEKQLRLQAMKAKLNANTLLSWWQTFGGQPAAVRTIAQRSASVSELRAKRHRLMIAK